MKNFFIKFKLEILVFVFFVLSRLPSLGFDIFNTDVWKWKARSYDFGTGIFTLDFEKTIQKYHPGVTLMWIGAVGVKVFNVYLDISGLSSDSIEAVFGLHVVQKTLVVCVIGVSLVFIFNALKKIVGIKYALISIFLLAFEPFYIALTRVFHLEGLMSTFMLVSILWFYLFLREKGKKSWLFISSFFSALAFLTKTSSLFLLPFFGLILFLKNDGFGVHFFSNIKKTAFTYLIWLLPTIFFTFLLWPALWTNAPQAFEAIKKGIFTVGIERDHDQYYFGKFVTNPGFTYYFVVFAFRSSVWMLAGLAGFFASRKKIIKSADSFFMVYLFIYVCFYFLEITIPSKKLDRYLLPSITGCVLISAFFFDYLFSVIRQKKLKILLVLVLTVFPTFTVAYLHPDYFSYYNPLLGGLRVGINVIEPKWLIGKDSIVDYFRRIQLSENFEKAPRNSSLEGLIQRNEVNKVLVVGFLEKYYTQVWPFFRAFDSWAVIEDLGGFAKHANYFVYPVWEDRSAEETRFKLQYSGSIKLRGVEVYKVYKMVH